MQKLFFLLVVILLAEAQGTYDPAVALSNLFLSYSAYCFSSEAAPWTCSWCNKFDNSNGSPFIVTASAYNTSRNVFAYVGESGNTAYVAFRGTQPTSLTNWLQVIDTIQIPYPLGPGKVHQGFYNNWLSVKNPVQDAITNLVKQDHITQVYFTGHSLGAAMTMLAALEVGTKLGKPFYVYTFGEPRVGNPDFANYWKSLIPPTNSYRVVNQADIVPHLPPRYLLLLEIFRHVPTEVWYNTSTSYRVCDTSGEDPKCSNSVLLPSVTDHLTYLGQNVEAGC